MPPWLLKELRSNPAVKKLTADKGPLPLRSLIQEALVISASYRERPRGILVVKQNLYTAQRLYEKVSSLLSESECALFGADESLRVEAIAKSPELTAQKVETMASLLENPDQVVITCPSALLRLLPSPKQFSDACIHLKTDEEMDMETLKQKLCAGGYRQTSHIDQPLCFAARGGIVDVYSINYEDPIRIEFFDNIIESIRFFHIETQKTIRQIDEAEIVPASDILLDEEQVQTIREKTEELLKGKEGFSEVEMDLNLMEGNIREARLYPYMAMLDSHYGIWDYMYHPLILLSDEEAVRESVKRMREETTAYIQEMVQEKKLPPRYAIWHEYDRIAPASKKVTEDPFDNTQAGIEEIHLPNELLSFKLKLINEPGRAVICLNETEMKQVIDTCIQDQIPYSLLVGNREIPEGISLYPGSFDQGFYLSGPDIRVYTAAELFSVRHHSGRYEKKFRSAEVIHSYDELDAGDYIVHAQYGVGQYVGIETREIKGTKRDFLKIIYRGNAELLVPLEQFRLVRKFVSREGVVPRLNKLGSDEWEKTKKRLEENVNNIAERLIKLYASREQHIGFAFSPDNEMTEKFERSFRFELTEDQKKAVAEVKKDMESSKPMDRLICGDVGFGKTEVAVRASFKAVSDNKQVAVLCPTTILAEQHYQTFLGRYEGYAVNIRVMDRFVPKSEQKKILDDLKEGRVDILIGTHRLLSKDVVFKDLGLLVVDEEQRFGVEHKEKIKELKTGIDVLTLSATPIPRTLQMSLVGIRQLSQLETPPLSRYSVQTYVVERNKGLITDAIQKELARGGQVFYLYNNIEYIYNIARGLQAELPDASIRVIHGRMSREEIEDNMREFTQGNIDVMVCTTIIENGIDIPNVNTILIDNAQDFGLSQIYQIKGRVGRSDRVAYAYLLIPPRKQLSEVAQKRLQAVKEFARLGSGYKIAMRDLTIRGAGDLLGPEQSGFIDTVGIDMYIEMLEEAITRQKDPGYVAKPAPAHVNINKTSYIPETFAPDDYDKLDMYQKIDSLTGIQGLEAYKQEVIDQYGRLPNEVGVLFLKKKMDIYMDYPEIDSYKEIKGQIEITFSKMFSEHVDGVALFQVMNNISKDLQLRYSNHRITIRIPKVKNDLALAIEVIEKGKKVKFRES